MGPQFLAMGKCSAKIFTITRPNAAVIHTKRTHLVRNWPMYRNVKEAINEIYLVNIRQIVYFFDVRHFSIRNTAYGTSQSFLWIIYEIRRSTQLSS